MIQHVNILTKDGKSLIFREYGATKVDQDLLAGFLSAFSGFMMEISNAEIKSTVTGNSKFIYSISDTLMVVICTDIDDLEDEFHPKLEEIFTEFEKQFGHIFKNDDWNGERGIFSSFNDFIDKVMMGPIKISILGYGGVGKTTLTRLIVGKDVNLEYIPTITADIANYNDLGKRKIILWDFAGQMQFSKLWVSLLRGTRIVLLVTDSTYKNVQATKNILKDFIKKKYRDVVVIGIANKQDLDNRLTAKFVEKIWEVPTYGMIGIQEDFRQVIHEILLKEIDEINEKDGLNN